MKKHLFFDFLLAILLLLVFELGVRVFLPHDVSGRFSYGYDSDSGFVETKDGVVHIVRAGGRRFHPQMFSLRRSSDTLRIMVLGDSVPRGPSFPAAYAHQLQYILHSKGIKSEVINLAIAGFGVRRNELIVCKILQYDPSLIILHLNDSNEYEDEREFRRSQDFSSWHPKHWIMKSFIFARAYEIKTEKFLWRLVPDKIRLQNATNDADAEIQASLDQAKQELWKQRVWEKSREMVALVRKHDIPLILVTQGVLGDGKDILDDHKLDELGHSLERPGVYLVSMKELFTPLQPVKPYFADSSHMTQAGHRILAAKLAELIIPRVAVNFKPEKRVERAK